MKKEADLLAKIAALEEENKQLIAIREECFEYKQRCKQQEEKFKNLVDNISEYIYCVDYDPDTNAIVSTYHSPQCEVITGYTPKDFIEDPFLWLSMVYESDKPMVNKFVGKVVNGLASGTIEHRIVRKDGRTIWVSNTCGVQLDEKGKLKRQFGFLIEITERKQMEDALRYNALNDSLTGLPNRKYFKDAISHAIARSRRDNNYHFAILFLDIDRFKNINDSFGHVAGDQLLMEISKRLKVAVRENDIVSRFAGDEFAVLLDNIDIYKTILVAERIQDEISRAAVIEDQKIFVTCSIGVLMCSEEYDFPEDMLRDADTAMYRAKNAGKACFEIFNAEMHEAVLNLMQLENDIKRGVKNREFEVYYQPIFSLESNKVTGVEALMRWNHPTKGLLLPIDFIPTAEETGIIIPLTEWLVEESAIHLKAWRDLSIPIRVSLNMTVNNLTQVNLVKIMKYFLKKNHLSLDDITVEITENTSVEQYEFAVTTLHSLRRLGTNIALDDFGTGYSSISYLKNLPVTELKIDKSFVQDLDNNANMPAIIRAIIAMAHSLKIKVIAEGVEDEKQYAFLKTHDCDEVQGFFICKPLSFGKMTEYLKKQQF